MAVKPPKSRDNKLKAVSVGAGQETAPDPAGERKTRAPSSGREKNGPTADPSLNLESNTAATFPVIGLGASAGGLEALERFFTALPDDTGMAFCVVVHHDPSRKTILPGLLQKHTRMKVQLAEDGAELRPDTVYVAPPDRDAALFKGVFHLLEQSAAGGLRLPIDSFFRSLAEDLGERATGIILSGTGSDGTLGIREIKGRGGLVIAQDEASAKYDGMPQAARATGLVDLTLPPEQMPARLAGYFSHPAMSRGKKRTVLQEKTEGSLAKIFLQLRRQTGHDFSLYKTNTIRRRIEKRLSVNKIDKISTYVRYLTENPAEVELLFHEILIGVTGFFRDPKSFVSLQEKVLPGRLAGLGPGETMRVWVPGCSTGEEAYSLAMVLREAMAQFGQEFGLQVFATDIDPYAIDKARAGVYPGSVAADISPERLQRYFIKENSTYRVKKEIRDDIVFSVQDILKDSPFSRLDLLCCRNLLIYLDTPAQKKVIPLFHYTLKPAGLLVIGSSESIGRFGGLFEVLDGKARIFRRKEPSPLARPVIDFPTGPWTAQPGTNPTSRLVPHPAPPDLAAVTQRIMLREYTPAGVVIDNQGNIRFIQGRTGNYLEPASGPANFNILDMAREGLRGELSSLIRRAAATREKASRTDLAVKANGDSRLVDLTVEPLVQPNADGGLLLVVFEEKAVLPTPAKTKKRKKGNDEDRQRREDLEKELQYSHEVHQATVEEMESANEELKSTNEELQSTNEELESSKEEQQSLNEELVTVNAELQAKIDELTLVHDDMRNVLNATEIATIFLNQKLSVRRFTPKATAIVNLIEADIGRPLEHVVHNLEYETLIKDAENVLQTLATREAEVRSRDGNWYQMRIMPYRTTDNVIDGVVLTFSDITAQKRIQEKLTVSEERFRVALTASRTMVFNQDRDLRYTWAPSGSSLWSDKALIGRTDADLFPPDEAAELKRIKAGVIDTGVGERRPATLTVQGEQRHFDLTVEPLRNASGHVVGVTIALVALPGREGTGGA